MRGGGGGEERQVTREKNKIGSEGRRREKQKETRSEGEKEGGRER